jgi:hypothetical protein
MTATNTNKQPVFVDRPLINRARLTNQVVGSSDSLVVQGGQSPALLVDMDATLSSDNNSGGIVDSIRIIRDNINSTVAPDYTVNTGTSGEFIGVVSGQTVYVAETGVLTNASEFGVGYYTYTGTVPLGDINTDITYSGNTGTNQGFTYLAVESGVLPSVTFACYHTRGTTVPIPADGDYVVLFQKTLGVNEVATDCSDVMPEITVPVPQQGNTSGIGAASPLKNRAINLQRGDRLYIGVVQRGAQSTVSGYVPGVHVVAQGGYY